VGKELQYRGSPAGMKGLLGTRLICYFIAIPINTCNEHFKSAIFERNTRRKYFLTVEAL
jgi:hypothetical protein